MERLWLTLLLGLATAGPAPGSPRQESAPLPVEARPEPQPSQAADDLFEGSLRGVRDGEGFGETPGYRRLLEILTRYGEEELVSKVERNLDMAAAQADPAAWRGHIVRVRGVIIGLSTERLESRIGTSLDAYRAVIWDGVRAAIVDFLAPPPAVRLERDVVDIEGVFLRTVRYESKGGQEQLAPYVVGRNLRVVDTDSLPRSTRFDSFAAILCGATAAFLIVRAILTVRRSHRQGQRPVLDASIRERAARALRTPPSTTKP